MGDLGMRVYGGRLHKVEPSELLKSSAGSLIEAARAVTGAKQTPNATDELTGLVTANRG